MNWVEFVSEQWPLVALLAGLAAVFFWNEGRSGGQTLGPSEVTRLLNSEQAVLVDIRETKDFKQGHIVGAINVPHTKVEERADELEKFRSRKIIIADKMGQHGGAAGKVLREKGYDVLRLRGGMAEWNGQNLPVVRE